MGAQVPNPLVVRVTDANDNPVSNVSVTWTAGVGGSVSDATTATNSAGLAQVERTLGLLPGPYTTTADVDGLAGSPVTFTSTATVGPPAKLAIVTQPGSPTTSGTAFVPAPVIQVQDLVGNPVSQGGIAVSASITSGQVGATLTNEDRNTNGSGRATFTNLQITGPPDNDYVLTFTASVGGNPLLPVSSTALTVTAGGATRIVIRTQPSATAAVGAIFGSSPWSRWWTRLETRSPATGRSPWLSEMAPAPSAARSPPAPAAGRPRPSPVSGSRERSGCARCSSPRVR